MTYLTSKKVLVAYFSHTGENYAVGNIAKGNTHIVAELIADLTDGSLFEIAPEKKYPSNYNACIDIAKKEMKAGARPAISGDINVKDYEVVFIGYPNWWGDLPMAVYTFIERHNWHGKTVAPFCTHEGSGLASTPSRVAEACEGATMAKGLAVRGATAQTDPEATRRAVEQWLEQLHV